MLRTKRELVLGVAGSHGVSTASDELFAFPRLILAIVISGPHGPSRTNAMLAIGIVFAPAFARVVRGCLLSVMQEGYIEAARVTGLPDHRMILRYLLPNITVDGDLP